MSYATNDLYKVIAIHPETRATKVVAAKVGAFRASKLAAKVQGMGFEIEVRPVNAPVIPWHKEE